MSESHPPPAFELAPTRIKLATRHFEDGVLTTIRPTTGERGAGRNPRFPSVPPRSAEALFELQALLGEGGMGVVHTAVQRSIGRAVAIKSLREEERSASAVQRLLSEAWLTASLEHPNVVPVHDVLVDAEQGPLIVLKLIDGASWETVMHDAEQARSRFGADDLLGFNLEILGQVCRAVHFAHSKGVLHRDIKPSNVMIGSFGEVYLLDWGIAVSLVSDDAGRFPLASEARGLAGTPCYMAPEMLDPESRGLSERTDVYLLGAVLYQIVSGQPPHVGQNGLAVLSSIERSQPRFDDGVPDELRDIVTKAMSPVPGDRFASAEELRLAVADFLRHRHAAGLAREAGERFEELRRLLGDPQNRDRIYELFGECRFGLQEALRGWSDNQRARETLERLVEAMIDFELKQGDAPAAASLLVHHPGPAAALRARVEAAMVERENQLADLEKMRRDLDPQIGRGARRAAMGAMGLVWTLAPLLANHVDPSTTPTVVNLASPVALLLLALVVWVFARRPLSETAINRRILVAMLVGFCAHMVHVLATQLAGLPPRSELAMGMVSFGAIAAVLAYTAERRLWPVVPVYWIGAVAAAQAREHSAYILSGCNALLAIYMIAIWSPRRQKERKPAR